MRLQIFERQFPSNGYLLCSYCYIELILLIYQIKISSQYLTSLLIRLTTGLQRISYVCIIV